MKTPVIPGRPSYHALGIRGGAFSGGHSPDSDIITVMEAGPEPPTRSSTLPLPLVETFPLPRLSLSPHHLNLVQRNLLGVEMFMGSDITR